MIDSIINTQQFSQLIHIIHLNPFDRQLSK